MWVRVRRIASRFLIRIFSLVLPSFLSPLHRHSRSLFPTGLASILPDYILYEAKLKFAHWWPHLLGPT